MFKIFNESPLPIAGYQKIVGAQKRRLSIVILWNLLDGNQNVAKRAGQNISKIAIVADILVNIAKRYTGKRQSIDQQKLTKFSYLIARTFLHLNNLFKACVCSFSFFNK